MKRPTIILIALLLTLLPWLPRQVTPVAAAPATTCYLVADSGGGNGGNDLLTRIDAGSSTEIKVGTGLGTNYVESNAFWPGSNVLYGANAGRLGTISLSTGVYSALPSSFGSGDGARGNLTFDDVDGLAFDPFSGKLYGVQRFEGSPNEEDVLIQINPATGSRVANAFGPGVDYLVIYSEAVVNLVDIDAMAVSSYDGQMVAIANSSGGNDRLVRIDKTTGLVSDVGLLGVTDMEGIGFDPNGTLYGTRGTAPYNLYTIDLDSGVATLDTALAPQGGDYEAVDCLTRKNTISGTVYQDADDGDGPAYKAGAGDAGTPGVVVRLYRDANGNGVVDAGDIWLADYPTAADGSYSLTVAATGAFVLDVDPDSLPAEATRMTSDNLEAADFGTAFDQVDAGNDFGWDGAPGRLAIAKSASPAGLVAAGGTITYTVTVANEGLAPLHQVVLTDVVPAGSAYVDGSAWLTAPVTSTGTYRDAFDVVGYDNSNGTIGWAATPWSETNDEGTAGGGTITISGGALVLKGLNNSEKRLTRQAAMADAVAATVSFTWSTGGDLEYDQDFVVLEAALTATGPWTNLLSLQGEVDLADGGDSGAAMLEIPVGLLGPETRLRFRVIGFEPASEWLTVDDFTVTVKERPAQGSAAGAPATLVDGQYLRPGEALTVTLQFVVDDPLDPSIDAIDNLAQAAAAEQAEPVEAGVSSPVAAGIGDFVWADLDGDGAQDPGEPGLAGVQVRLELEGGSVVTTTTGADGSYRFELLAAGAYTVTVDAATLPAGYLPTTPAAQSRTLSPGELELTADFGFTLMDFGDLPDESADPAYHFVTRLAGDPARHAVTSLFLGSAIDGEADGQPQLLATGDGADEDGVAPTGAWQSGRGSVMVTASGAGYLSAWMDMNQNYQFDPGEQVLTNTVVAGGMQVLGFDLPYGAERANGQHYFRFRLAADPLAAGAHDGYGGAGEVEDYLFGATPTAVRLGGVSAAGEGAAVTWWPWLAALLLGLVSVIGALPARRVRVRMR